MGQGTGRLGLVFSVLFLCMLLLERKLSFAGGIIELFVLVLSLIMMLMVLMGVAKERTWAWPTAIILCSLLIFNLVVLYAYTKSFLPFFVGTIFIVYGLLLSIHKSANAHPVFSVNHLQIEEPPNIVVYEKKTPKRTVKKPRPRVGKTRKKTSRKKKK